MKKNKNNNNNRVCRDEGCFKHGLCSFKKDLRRAPERKRTVSNQEGRGDLWDLWYLLLHLYVSISVKIIFLENTFINYTRELLELFYFIKVPSKSVLLWHKMRELFWWFLIAIGSFALKAVLYCFLNKRILLVSSLQYLCICFISRMKENAGCARWLCIEILILKLILIYDSLFSSIYFFRIIVLQITWWFLKLWQEATAERCSTK